MDGARQGRRRVDGVLAFFLQRLRKGPLVAELRRDLQGWRSFGLVMPDNSTSESRGVGGRGGVDRGFAGVHRGGFFRTISVERGKVWRQG